MWNWRSVRNTNCRFRSDRQGSPAHVSVVVIDVLTDTKTVRVRFFLKTFTEQSSACSNLSETWLQITFALVDQTRGHIGQFRRHGRHTAWLLRTGPGSSASPTLESARLRNPAVKRVQDQRRSRLLPSPFLACVSLPNVSFLFLRWRSSS